MSRSQAHQRTYQLHARKKHVRRYELDELFDLDELAVKMKVARNRITAAFVYSTEWRRGRKYVCHDNYIVNVGSKQKDLVEHIFGKIIVGKKHGIITCSELPERLGNRPSYLLAVANDASRRLVAVELSRMVQDEIIWYNAHHGTWEITQTAVDTYHGELASARDIRKVDERLRRESRHNNGRLEVVH